MAEEAPARRLLAATVAAVALLQLVLHGALLAGGPFDGRWSPTSTPSGAVGQAVQVDHRLLREIPELPRVPRGEDGLRRQVVADPLTHPDGYYRQVLQEDEPRVLLWRVVPPGPGSG